jgi:hypothetical protein
MSKYTLVLIGALLALAVYGTFLAGVHCGSRETMIALYKARVESSGVLSERSASSGVSQGVVKEESPQKPSQEPGKALNGVSKGDKPLYFSRFRVIIDISLKDEQEEEFALKQTKELASLIKALDSIRDVGIVGVKGGSEREGVVEYFVIE